MKNKCDAPTGKKPPLSIRDGCICNTKKLLVLAPHPDDFDAIGVTLKFLSGNGNPLEVIVASTGSGVEESYSSADTPEARMRLREREQRNSASFFGLTKDCLTIIRLKNDEEDQPADNLENIDRLEKLIRQKAPDIIFLPHGNDTNAGHRAIYSMARKIALRCHLPLALLLIRDPKTISMRADFYLSFGGNEAAWKAELLRFHDTQQQRNLNTRGYGFDERILTHNRQIARELSLDEPYAEAFELEAFNVKAIKADITTLRVDAIVFQKIMKLFI
jgi:LmbE family N-acetylglucosaminyl deacetylase